LLPYILFEKYIYILALEMASSWNQQSANASCIGTLSFPIGQITYDFVFHFYRKYMPISFHLGDIA